MGARLLGVTESSNLIGRSLADFLHADHKFLFEAGGGGTAIDGMCQPLVLLAEGGRGIHMTAAIQRIADDSDDAFLLRARIAPPDKPFERESDGGCRPISWRSV